MAAIREIIVDESRAAYASAAIDADHRGQGAVAQREVRDRLDGLLYQEEEVQDRGEQVREFLDTTDRRVFEVKKGAA